MNNDPFPINMFLLWLLRTVMGKVRSRERDGDIHGVVHAVVPVLPEYKMLVLDHLSDLAEQRAVAAAAAAASSSPSSSSGQDGALLEPGWGSACVRRLCVIRDLKGFQVSERLESEKKVQFI